MSLAAPQIIIEPFAENGLRNAIPVAASPTPGAAAFDTGFPPLTMQSLASGGIPPQGLDFNGILWMISAYCAWIQGGGAFNYDANFVAQNTGYSVGAVLQSAANPARYYRNTLADNANDPDVDLTGWIPFSPSSVVTELQTDIPAAGPHNDYPLGDGVGFLDFNPTSGAITVSGLEAGFDGQEVTCTNKHASNSVTLLALNGGSLAANQFRMAADITLLRYGCITFKYSSSLALWVQI